MIDKLIEFYQLDLTQFWNRLKSSKITDGKYRLARQFKRVSQVGELRSLFEKSYTYIGEALSCTAYVTDEPVSFAERFKGKPITLREGDAWAEKTFDCAWFHIKGSLPAVPVGELVLILDTAGEGLVYDTEGRPKQGITCRASQFDYVLGKPVKKVVFLDGLIKNGEIEFYVDAAANDLFGNMKNASKIQTLRVARVNRNIRALAYDAEVLATVSDYNKNDDYNKKLYAALCEVFKAVKNIDEEKAAALRQKLAPFLAAKNEGEVFKYSAIGHSHLDLAWLWPIRETKRKGARTFCNQFVNLEHYPDYIFGASQAQLYQWMKDGYPELYDRMKEYVEAGRWEVQGATWVEMDSNLIGGLSMLKQFYYGKKYFLEEFGLDMQILWLPDSFGYSACLPQVMKLANVPYFLTQKMSWNTVNKFPYHTFNWLGLDGTPVFAHMLPENTYNGPARGDYMKMGERNYSERKISDKSMSLFGIGDGGGGPGFEHCERAMRYKDLKGMPTYTMEKAADFFKRLDDKVTPYPTHKGELYLEKHQGTYTTQGRNKKYNRKCEFLFRNYEILEAIARVKGICTPIGKAEEEELWKEVLLYQFHDILPGSSINRVYEESQARYAKISERLNEGIAVLSSKLFKGKGFVNFNSVGRSELKKVDGRWLKINAPAVGFTPIEDCEEQKEFKNKRGGDFIENDRVKVVFKDGLIISLFDKAMDREILPEKAAFNRFSTYNDIGDCWDIMPKKYQKFKKPLKCLSFSTESDGARVFARVEFSAKEVTVKQEISLVDGSPLVRFDTVVNNAMKSKMLRVEFPVRVKTDECSFNVQFGHLKRKTTENNSVEQAQFETSGQKFVDMSGDEFGVTLINDCKYGFRCKGNVIDMDVMRSPLRGPGRDVDFGESTFTYAVLPHLGGIDDKIYEETYALNNPLIAVENGTGDVKRGGFFSSENRNLILEGAGLSDNGKYYVLYVYNSSEEKQSGAVEFNGERASFEVDLFDKVIGDEAKDFNGFELKCLQCKLN